MTTFIQATTLGLLFSLGAPAHASPAIAPSPEAQRVARWAVESGDNRRLPYLVIDKANAQVFLFNPRGELLGAAPALLGMARGDRLTAPNEATLAQIPPEKRITPAGRFLSRLAVDSEGKELLVMDYRAAISLHAVIKGTPEERRAERLSSETSQDNRISYGCINVPKAFYSSLVSATFAHTPGVVYVLPETESASALFGIRSESTLASGGPTGSRSQGPGTTASMRATAAR
jgi:hypothetical protein